MNKQEWTDDLKRYIQMQRRANPVPERDNLSEEDEWHCRIIGGDFMGWDQSRLRDILGERKALRVMKFDPKPLIVFTTSNPGLVAIQEILSKPPVNLVYLLHDEYVRWKKTHTVDLFTFHIHHWSYFRPISNELLERASAAFPDVHNEEFRIHTSGDIWGEQCGIESDHLWNWEGEQMNLLEEGFSQIIF